MIEKRTKHVLEEPVAATVISHRFSHVVWGAIFAGVVMVLVTQLALSLLGSSIGLTAASATDGERMGALSIGAFLWWVVSGCVSFYIGGLVSGRMAGIPRRTDGALHGVLMWAVTAILMFFMLTSTIGGVISGAFGMLKTSGQAVANATPAIAGSMAESMDLDQIRVEVRQSLEQRGGNVQQMETVMGQLAAAITTASRSEDPDAGKDQIASVLVRNTNMTREEARATVDRWDANIQQAKVKVQESADAAAKAAAATAFAGFVMLTLGAVFGGWGGSVGAPHWSEQEIA